MAVFVCVAGFFFFLMPENELEERLPSLTVLMAERPGQHGFSDSGKHPLGCTATQKGT